MSELPNYSLIRKDNSVPGIYLIEEKENGKPSAVKTNTAGGTRVPSKGEAEEDYYIEDVEKMNDRLLDRPKGLAWPWKELAKLSEIDIEGITAVVAGTSHGKTSVALNLALYFLRQDKRVFFWSGEMSPEILTGKIQCLQAEVSLKLLISELERRRAGMPIIKAVYDAISNKDLYKKLCIPPSQKYMKCYQVLELANKAKPEVIIIDYIQQLRPGKNKYRTRDEEIEVVMDSLNQYSSDTKIPIILFGQINREARNVEKPTLTSIRHSATVEQYSSNVIGVWNATMARYKGSNPCRPTGGWYWVDDVDATAKAVAFAEAERKTLVEMIILKSRFHGHTAKSVPLLFDGPTGALEDFPAVSSKVVSI